MILVLTSKRGSYVLRVLFYVMHVFFIGHKRPTEVTLMLKGPPGDNPRIYNGKIDKITILEFELIKINF